MKTGIPGFLLVLVAGIALGQPVEEKKELEERVAIITFICIVGGIGSLLALAIPAAVSSLRSVTQEVEKPIVQAAEAVNKDARVKRELKGPLAIVQDNELLTFEFNKDGGVSKTSSYAIQGTNIEVASVRIQIREGSVESAQRGNVTLNGSEEGDSRSLEVSFAPSEEGNRFD